MSVTLAQLVGKDVELPPQLAARAVAMRRSSGLRSPISAKPAAKTTAALTLRRPQAAMVSSTLAAGSVRIATSTPSGNWSTDSSTVRSPERPTRWMSPAKSFSTRLPSTTWPADCALLDMPMTAAERGRSSASTAEGFAAMALLLLLLELLERAGDLAAMLTNLQPNDVLFIDEIHRQIGRAHV